MYPIYWEGQISLLAPDRGHVASANTNLGSHSLARVTASREGSKPVDHAC